MTPDPYENLDAVYLLAALPPDERADFEAHLRDCPGCRARVEELRPVLPLLAGTEERILDAPPDEVPPLPDTLLPRLLATSGRARRRRKALVTALAGLTAASAAGLVLVLTAPWTTAPAPGQPMAQLRPGIVNATAALTPTDWGTRITLTCWYQDGAVAPAGYSYSLTVRSKDGTTHQLGSWQLSSGQQITFTAGTALTEDQITAVDITDGYGTNLLELTS